MFPINTRRSERNGQFLFNFLEWLATERGVPTNQSFRCADTFHLSDELLDLYYKEFLNEHGY